MRKKIIYVLLFLLLLSVFPGILLFTEWTLPSIYMESYYAELPVLYQKLTESSKSKIVIIGGSNVAFGVDSTLLETCLSEKGYDYAVCPFGLYGAVGTSAMLDLSLETLKNGDIVILSFEPISDAMSPYFGATAFLKCAEDTPLLITKLDKTRSGAVIGNYIEFLQTRYSIVQSGDYPKAEGVYSKAAFDETGNMTYSRDGNIMTIGYDVASPVDFERLEISAEFANQVNEYCEKAAKKGATVYYSFCPVNKSAVENSSELLLSHYFDVCNETFNCRIISNPKNYLLDSGWFYDSNFHLNTAGAGLRTIQLVKDLLPELGCYESIDVPLPNMPVPAAQSVIESIDMGYFVFEELGNQEGYLITGLTENGQQMRELRIPSSYNGKPVVGFSPDALKNNTILEEICIPSSVVSLPDYLFASCTSLNRLILEHTESPCKLSDHSMDGTENIKIFVPADSYSLYRDGYGCEANPWAKYLSQIFTY